MTDQVNDLIHEPNHYQIGEPGAPCNGSSTCTDCTIARIIFHDKKKLVSAHDVRQAAAPSKDPCRGLNANEAMVALRAFGVTGYQIMINATASDAIKGTDLGLVLTAVGYNGWPLEREAEVGGRTDLGFSGPHATGLAGRRNWQTPPKDWPAHKPFKPGWRVWAEDPDHHWGSKTPPYDRFSSAFLVRAMDAIVGNEGWRVRMIISRRPSRLLFSKTERLLLGALDELHTADVLPSLDLDQLPDFGSGQSGDPA